MPVGIPIKMPYGLTFEGTTQRSRVVQQHHYVVVHVQLVDEFGLGSVLPVREALGRCELSVFSRASRFGSFVRDQCEIAPFGKQPVFGVTNDQARISPVVGFFHIFKSQPTNRIQSVFVYVRRT